MKISVIIPAHNEEDSLAPTVTALIGTLTTNVIEHEVVIVNDHSLDATREVAQRLCVENPQCRIVDNEDRPGYGMAVRCGLDHYTGDAVVIAMADASDDPCDVVKYYRELTGGYDCVFGSRFMKDSRVEGYPVHKLLLNRLVNLGIRILFMIRFNDVTNAFKAFRRETIDGLRPILSKHFNLTVELPLKAIVRGYTYKVVPISWHGRAKGVSKLKLKEMGSRYMFIVLYVWMEKLLARGDYSRASQRV